MTQIKIPLRKLVALLSCVLLALCIAGAIAEYARYILGSKSPVVDYFSLTEEQNVPTWWSSFLLLADSVVLWAIVATTPRKTKFRAHWIVLSAIFCYMSIDELVEIHEWLNNIPALENLHGLIHYGWVIPAGALVLVFASSYLRFLFHLPMKTRFKIALAGVLYVGGALGIELILGLWTDKHGELNFAWAMIGLVEEALEIVGSSLFLVALLEYLGGYAPEIRIDVR
jgi:hypothetical protein